MQLFFLVESNSEIAQQPQAEVFQAPIPMSIESQVTTIQTQIPMNGCGFQPVGEVNQYEQFDEETILSQERIDGVVNLSYWVSRYCMLGMIISFVHLYLCFYSVIPWILYTLGFIGTRTLNRCLLAIPLLISLVLGFGLSLWTIYALIEDYKPCEFFLLIIGLLHVVIFFCMCKLMCRIGKLSCQEWWQARVRIRSSCCCRRP